jgi:membrane protein DedA with SNARE-associated domain
VPARKNQYEHFRTALTYVAAARIVIGIAAIPLAPVLYEKHFLWLVLMRPTKEVLLAGGFLARQDKVGLIELLIAAVPLALLGVWQFFALGRAWAREIGSDKLPWVARRILPTKKIKELRKTLRKRGARIIFIGRLAVFPSALLGATAGSSDMHTSEFLRADTAGGLLSIAEVVGAGYLFGSAYKSAGPWITVVGVIALLGMLFFVGRTMRKV